MSVLARPAWRSGRGARVLTGTAAFLPSFALAAAGVGLARAITTTYVPVLLDRIDHAPGLIGLVMLVNAAAGFVVPLLVGLWSDRARDGRLGRRLPFLVAGSVFSGGGLVAVALGTASSYLVLGAAAAVVYVGLNASTTAHRAIVAESFRDRRRPAATSAQELAMLAGALLGIVAGGALAASSPSLLFLGAAVALPLLALPTVAAAVGLRRPPSPEEARGRGGLRAWPRDLSAALRRPGPRRILLAQVLWVMAYAALPTFMVLYADSVLGLGVGAASLLTAGFAALTGLGLLVAGRQRPERVFPVLVGGAALLGAGLVTAAPADSLAAAAPSFAVAALGAGLVTALGFPYFSRFIPEGESGRYSGLYFASRAIASGLALPIAGFTVAATGSYRALLLQGAAALVALVPLLRAERSVRTAPAAGTAGAISTTHGPVERVTAVIPCLGAGRLRAVVEGALPHVDEIVIVDDGTPAELAPLIDPLAALPGVRVHRLTANAGKGDAVQAGVTEALAGATAPDAVVVLDADGQHPPDTIPAFLTAARGADVVIGDRTADLEPMPRTRRFTNNASSRLLGMLLRRRLPDSQCGMRLYRAAALRRCPPPSGRYEAETLHLRAIVRSGLTLAWVPIPALYGPAVESSFRPAADTVRVLLALFGCRSPSRRRLRRPNAEFARFWARRLAAVVGGSLVVAALLPVLGSLDNRAFLTIHSLGDGPGWLYGALDPHMRNYFILGGLVVLAAARLRVKTVVGVAVTLLFAAYFSNGLLQLFYEAFDRPRPEEVLDGLFVTSHGRSWAHIESFPSGHMVITTAVAAAGASVVPALRGVLGLYIAVVAVTRITFGAHFPLDVLVGAAFGYEVGRFSAALGFATGLLEVRPARLLPWLGSALPAKPAEGASAER